MSLAFKKTYQEGPVAIGIDVENGQASITASASVQAGGGELAGVAKANFSAGVQVSEDILIDVGFLAAEAKFPSVKQYLELARTEIKSLIDAKS